MRKTLIIAIACVLVVGLTATNADATTLTVDSSEYVGYYRPPTGNDPTASLGYLLELITLTPGQTDQTTENITYNRVGSDVATLPTPTAAGATTPTHTAPFNVSPDTYIVGRYDGAQGFALVWLVGEVPLTNVALPTSWTPPGRTSRSLNQVTLYQTVPPQSVPDGGMTLVLLGSALVGLETLRRKFSA